MSYRNGIKLIDLKQMPLGQLMELLQNRPEWMVRCIMKMRAVTA